MNVLNEPVLVLNRNWQYIAVATANEAIKDLFTGVSTAVDPDTYVVYTFDDWVERGVQKEKSFIQTGRVRIEVPEVIVLESYDKIPRHSMHYSKHHIYKRDRFICQYCGKQLRRDETTIDHVVPRSQGGLTSWANCVTACEPCNSTKADQTPEQAKMKLRHKPVKPTWSIQHAVRRMSGEAKPSWGKFIGA
jgi:5-methylcytosine-specific restriction endonuclease McrA